MPFWRDAVDRPRCVLAPHVVHETLCWNDLPGAQEQRREEGPLPQATEWQRTVAADDLERT